MWPEHSNTGDPFGEEPAERVNIWPWVVDESHRDPTIDQVTAMKRAWLRYAAETITNRDTGKEAA